MDHTEQRDVAIIGGGQSGLAAGAELARRGIDAMILEEHDRIGDGWRERWDSLRLYSPSQYDGLPGMPFPAPRNTFPSAREMAAYLEAYAAAQRLEVRTGVRVTALDGLGADGAANPSAGQVARFQLSAGSRVLEARAVIVAGGAFRHPKVPSFASELDPGIVQLHAGGYRGPAQLPDGPVLVVGLSHSGSDIAWELARAGRRTHLSGRAHGQLPFPIESRRGLMVAPLIAFAEVHVMSTGTPVGRRLRRQFQAGHAVAPLVRHRVADLIAAGVEHHPVRTVGATGGRPLLEDGTLLDVAAVVWCTGFEPDYSWIHLPVTDAGGWPALDRGASPVPGLFFLGIPFQSNAASMLVHGAGRDARAVVRRVARHLEGAPARGMTAAAASS